MCEQRRERGAQGWYRGQARWLRLVGPDNQRIEVVLEHHVLFRREVPEEGGLGDVSRFDDLLDRGGVVTLLAEKPQRVCLDRCAGLCLLAFPQARPRLISARWHAWPLSLIARTAEGCGPRQEDQRQDNPCDGDPRRNQQRHVRAGDGGAEWAGRVLERLSDR